MTFKLTVVFNVVDLNIVPLMREPLSVKLHSVIVFALLKQMSVQGGDVYDVSVDKTKY